MARSRANGTMETALQNGKVLSPLCPASCLKTSRFLSHMEVLLPLLKTTQETFNSSLQISHPTTHQVAFCITFLFSSINKNGQIL